MPVFFLLSRHAQSVKSSFIFKECPKTVVLAVVRAMHQWHLATSRQKTKAWICTRLHQHLSAFLSNISSTWCFPIRRALLRLWHLVAHCLPCRESASWEAQAWDGAAESRRTILSPDWCAFIVVGGDRWCACKCPQMPSCAFQHCTSTWALFVKYLKNLMLPHPQSVAKTVPCKESASWEAQPFPTKPTI